MDAITLLKNDHKTVEQLFKQFEKAGDLAFTEKRRIVDKIITELSVHAAVEEQLFYPAARLTVPESEDIALESIEEHHIVKWELSELEDMDPTDERFDAKVTVLIENVRHHVEEEEQDFFPKVRDELGRNELNDLGDAMVGAKKLAPTHPHPTSPDTPPGNFAVGAVVGVIDRVGDIAKGVAQGSVTAAKDVVSLVLHRRRYQAAPTGSPVTRKQAEKVRAEVADSVDAVTEAAKETVSRAKSQVRTAEKAASTAGSGARRTATTAKRGVESTAKAAKAGAMGTATTARRSARSTSTTAKRASTTTGRTAKAAAGSTVRSAKKTATDTEQAVKA